jgi:hypothetical protein
MSGIPGWGGWAPCIVGDVSCGSWGWVVYYFEMLCFYGLVGVVLGGDSFGTGYCGWWEGKYDGIIVDLVEGFADAGFCFPA